MSNRCAAKGKYRPQTVRKRRKRQMERLILTGAVLILTVLLIVIVRSSVINWQTEKTLQADLAAHADTFQPGVTINGVELTGYGKEEAYDMLMDKYAANISASLQLTFGEKSWSFTPSQVGADIDLDSQIDAAWAYGKTGTELERQEEIHFLRENPVNLTTELTFDAEALDAFVESIRQEVDMEPVNATMRVVDSEKFEFTDSAVGYRLDASSLKEQLTEFILSGGAEQIELKPEILEPNPSRAELEASAILLAECTTSLEGSSGSRNNNVNLALGYFNFLEVEPGETVSFNKLVGKRTKKNGYFEAPEFAGATVVTGVGGGVCQASTTVYGAVIRAGLEIVERYPHTMTVAYVKASQDAAVTNDDKDLRFKNNTESTLYFFASTDSRKETATVKIYGKPLNSNARIDIVTEVRQTDIRTTEVLYQEDKEGTRVWYTDDTPVLLQQGKPGVRSTAYRITYDLTTGEEISREKLSSDYYAPQKDIYLIGVHPRG